MKSKQPTLGTLLRKLRARNDWTLKEMSERTGIPVSTLSKVEHDRLTLTYDKLQQLSHRLNIRMSELFAEGDIVPDAPVTARRSVGRIDRAIRVNTKNYDKSAIPILVRSLRHENPTLRQVACLSLAVIPYEAAEKDSVVPALATAAANDDDTDVRQAAYSALSIIAPEIVSKANETSEK